MTGRLQRAATLRDRETHNARHQRALVLSISLCECAQNSWAVMAKSACLSARFRKGGGLKNRRLGECKMSISEVLISVTLSVRGEVAERLKAAVC